MERTLSGEKIQENIDNLESPATPRTEAESEFNFSSSKPAVTSKQSEPDVVTSTQKEKREQMEIAEGGLSRSQLKSVLKKTGPTPVLYVTQSSGGTSAKQPELSDGDDDGGGGGGGASGRECCVIS